MILASLGLLAGPGAAAQTAHSSGMAGGVNLGSVNVGSTSATAAVSFTFDSSGELDSTMPYQVVTQGTPNLDFKDAGSSTCAANTTYSAGNTCTVSVSLTPMFAGTRYGAVNLYGSSGNEIATGYVYGTGVGPQIHFLPGTETTIPVVGLNSPNGVAADSSGKIYVSDWNHGRVLEETPAAGSYTQTSVLTGLTETTGVAVDGSGSIYALGWGSSQLWKETWNGTSYTQSMIGSGMREPNGVTVDGSGNVYVADSANNRILLETLSSGTYTQSVLLTGGTGSFAGAPSGVAVDGSGDLFITSYLSGLIVELTPSAGGYKQSTIGSGLDRPSYIAVDGSGDLYVADTLNSRIVRETPTADGYVQSVVSSSSLDWPWGVGVDASGNVYISDTYHNRVLKEDFADPPSLNFPTATGVGSTDTKDGTQSVQVVNDGNAALTFTDLSYPADFPEASGDADACTGSTSVDPGQSCDLPIEFAPTQGGVLNESVTLTDNALNVAGAQQSIAVSGTGAAPTPPFMSAPAPGSTLTGSSVTFTWNPGFGSSAFMLKVGTTGAGSSNIYNGGSTTATSVTVSNIPLQARPLYVQLSYEMGTTWTSINYQYGEGDGSPFGALGSAADSVTGSTTVGSADSVKITGWAADWLDGAPLSNVTVFIDGVSVGTPTLGIARSDVAAKYANPAYVSSGYQLFYSASTLSLGSHSVTVVATDSGGRSATFGPRIFTVATTAGAGAPFGSIDAAVDSTTGSTTVAQSDTLKVGGWLADATDGAPLSAVNVDIDGVSVGTPTLGIARPDVAAFYHNAAYTNSGYLLLYPASGLSLGAHQVTVSAVDSGGRTKTLGPRQFTVAATAVPGPPVGDLGGAVDSVSGSTTVSPADSVKITGWVADPTDGAPLSNVTVYIDGASAGTPTLGIRRPDVAARYHNPAWTNSGFEMLYPAANLTAGTHSVLAVAIDSSGRSTTLKGRTFAVE